MANILYDVNGEGLGPESFLFNLDYCRESLRKYPRTDNSASFKKIDNFAASHAPRNA